MMTTDGRDYHARLVLEYSWSYFRTHSEKGFENLKLSHYTYSPMKMSKFCE